MPGEVGPVSLPVIVGRLPCFLALDVNLTDRRCCSNPQLAILIHHAQRLGATVLPFLKFSPLSWSALPSTCHVS